MPSQGHRGYRPLQFREDCWTDALPVCNESGVGFSTNQLYRADGQRSEEHECEDKSFHFKVDNSTYLYGVFDGIEGTRTANFAIQRLPAELLLGQLNNKLEDDLVKDVLSQAFISVEKAYHDTIDDLLADKANLQIDLPQGWNAYGSHRNYPVEYDFVQKLEKELSTGTTAVIALIHCNKIYVANVGDSRALLCTVNPVGVLNVLQISSDHDLNNEDEVLRLKHLGLDIESIRQNCPQLANGCTRCLGNYYVKEGYREIEHLRSAKSEPVIAEPDVTGGIPLENKQGFLMLMSDGLYRTLEEATGTKQANLELAQLTLDQFQLERTLTGVAQAVIDRVVRIHHDVFMQNNVGGGASRICQRRDDITLLVRSLNYPLRSSFSGSPGTPMSSLRMPSFNSVINSAHSPEPSAVDMGSYDGGSRRNSTITDGTAANSPNSAAQSITNSSTNTSKETSGSARLRQPPVESYIDFSHFFRAVEEAGQAENLIRLASGDSLLHEVISEECENGLS